MLTLNNIDQVSPSYARLLTKLLPKLQELQPDIDIAGLVEFVRKILEEGIDHENMNVLQPLLEELGIKVDMEDIKRIYGHWQTLTAPISDFKELKDWSIDWDTSKVAGGSDEISLKLAAKADTSVEVWNKERAAQEELSISDADVVLNHEVTGGFSANGAAAYTSGYATASIGIEHAREMEFDRYFQFPASYPTYKAILTGFSGGLVIWDLSHVTKALSPCVNGTNCQGLRKLSLRTTGKFAFNGAVGFGRAWSKQGEGKFSDVSAGLNLKLGLSKTFEYSGGVHIDLSKSTQSSSGETVVRAKVELNDTTQDSLSFSLNANAEIKGLDEVAKRYILPLFDDADELVVKLEKWSSPAEQLIKKITAEQADQWFDPLIKLVFGETDSNQVYNELIKDELSTLVDRYVQDPKVDPTTLANKLVSKLLGVFELDESDQTVAQIAKELSVPLEEQFKTWKKTLEQDIDAYIAKHSATIVDALAPLERLGVSVNSLAGQADEIVNDKIQYAVGQYQGFKEKVLKGLEKSANIQIGLALALEQAASAEKAHNLVIDFIDAEHELSKSLYAALILGKNKQFARLLEQAQRAGAIFVPQESISSQYTTGSSLSFNLDFSGIGISNVKNINTQLAISVDNLGNMAVKGSASAIAVSNAFGETRKASMALTYDLANAALDERKFANFAINYTNKDTKKHKVSEMNEILSSLSLPDGELGIADEPMADIIEPNSISSHLNWYQTQLQTRKFSVSEVNVFVGDAGQLIETLKSADLKDAFRFAVDRILELSSRSHQKRTIAIVAAYQDAVNKNIDLAESLNRLGDETKMKESKVRKVVEKSKEYGDAMQRVPGSEFKKYVRAAKRTYKKANALEQLIDILQSTLTDIEEIRAKGLPPKELEEQLSNLLLSVNKRLASSLAEWTEVNNFLVDWLQGGIDKTLVTFLSILLTLAGSPKGFIRVTLTLNDKDDNKVIRVIA